MRKSQNNYLLDTNIFLWWLHGDRKLADSVRKLISNPVNRIMVSVVSGWEISIKHSAGKLPLKTTLKRCFEISEFEVLSISLNHVLRLEKLPLHHKDPFDRLLISQAKAENLTLITSDEKIWKYKVDVLKC